MLDYKAEWYGRKVVNIDRWFPSSKTWSSCHQVVTSLPLSIREWQCPSCGESHDRDIHAALNIQRAAGLVIQPVKKATAALRGFRLSLQVASVKQEAPLCEKRNPRRNKPGRMSRIEIHPFKDRANLCLRHKKRGLKIRKQAGSGLQKPLCCA